MHAPKHPHAAGALEGEPAPKRPHHSDAAFTRGRRDQQAGPHTASTRWRSLAQLLGRSHAKAATTASIRGGAGHVRSSDDGAAARDFVAGAGDGNAAVRGAEPRQDGVLAAAAARALALGGAPMANGSGRRAARGGGAPTPCPSLGSPLQDARVTGAPGVGSTTGSSSGGIPIQVPAPEAAVSAAVSAAVNSRSGSSSSRGSDSGTQQHSPFAAVSALGTPPPSGGGTRTPSRGASQPGSAGISQAAVGRGLCTVPERSGLREPPPTPAYSRAQSLEPLPFARSTPTTPPSTPICLSTSPSAVSTGAPAMPPPLALAAEAAAEARDASGCRAASGSLTTTASTPIAAGSSSSSRSGGCSGAVGVGDPGDISSGQLSAAMRGLAVRGAAASDSLQEAANRTEHGDDSESPCNADGSVLVAQAPRRLLTQLSARAPPVPPPAAALAGADATRPNRSVTELPPSERPACWEDVSPGADAPVGRHGLEADATPAAPARAPSLLNRGRRPLWGCACLATPQTLYGGDSD